MCDLCVSGITDRFARLGGPCQALATRTEAIESGEVKAWLKTCIDDPRAAGWAGRRYRCDG